MVIKVTLCRKFRYNVHKNKQRVVGYEYGFFMGLMKNVILYFQLYKQLSMLRISLDADLLEMAVSQFVDQLDCHRRNYNWSGLEPGPVSVKFLLNTSGILLLVNPIK